MDLFTRITTFLAGSLAVLSIVGFYYEPDLFAWYEVTWKITENFALSPKICKILIGGIGEMQGKVVSLFTVFPTSEENIVLGGRLALGGSIVMLASSFLNSSILNGVGTLLFGFVLVISYIELSNQIDVMAQPGLGFFMAVGALVLNILGVLTSGGKGYDG